MMETMMIVMSSMNDWPRKQYCQYRNGAREDGLRSESCGSSNCTTIISLPATCLACARHLVAHCTFARPTGTEATSVRDAGRTTATPIPSRRSGPARTSRTAGSARTTIFFPKVVYNVGFYFSKCNRETRRPLGLADALHPCRCRIRPVRLPLTVWFP